MAEMFCGSKKFVNFARNKGREREPSADIRRFSMRKSYRIKKRAEGGHNPAPPAIKD